MPLFTTRQGGSRQAGADGGGGRHQEGAGTGEMDLRQIASRGGDEGGTPPPTAGGPGAADGSRPEGVDLERLAREVYAILEQRLVVERESQDL
ncbi:MAG TPA: hypothetical protein VLH58_01110 [Candidatus Methylomirabilis sp.]|nr:hypothetical protein [Candidatus Methylomirabilis sp.]